MCSASSELRGECWRHCGAGRFHASVRVRACVASECVSVRGVVLRDMMRRCAKRMLYTNDQRALSTRVRRRVLRPA